jgi:hypothetical protein
MCKYEDEKQEQEQNVARALNMHEDICKSLINKDEVILKVNIKDIESAEQILEWLYDKDQQHMKAELLQLTWDSEVISGKEAQILKLIKEVYGVI